MMDEHTQLVSVRVKTLDGRGFNLKVPVNVGFGPQKTQPRASRNVGLLLTPRLSTFPKPQTPNSWPGLAFKQLKVDAFKARLMAESAVPESSQRLVFKGKVLESGKSLLDYAVKENSNIVLVESLPGSEERALQRDSAGGLPPQTREGASLPPTGSVAPSPTDPH
jgi:hypothetical protein